MEKMKKKTALSLLIAVALSIAIVPHGVVAQDENEDARIRRVVDALVKDILGNPVTADKSTKALVKMVPESERVTPVLIDALQKNRTAKKSIWGYFAWSGFTEHMGPQARLIVPDACDIVAGGPGVVISAAAALGMVDVRSEITIPALRKALSKGQGAPDVSLVLAKLGYVDDKSMEVVRNKLLKPRYYQVRQGVSRKIGKLGKKGTAFIPVLLEALLVDDQRGAQEDARKALLKICPRGRVDDPEVVAVMKAVNTEAFAEALKETTCMPSLLADVQHIFSFLPGQSDRISALEKALTVGADDKPVRMGMSPSPEELKLVGEQMKRRNKRTASARALGNELPPATMAVRALTKALGDSSTFVQQAAVDALGQIGPAARTAAPALVALCKSAQDPSVVKKGAYTVYTPHVPGLKLRMHCALALLKMGEKERGSTFLKELVRNEVVDLTKLAGPLKGIGEKGLLRELCRLYWSGTDQWRRYHALMALCNADAVDGAAAAAILQETREHETRAHSGSPPMKYGCVRLAPTRLGQGSASSRPVFEKALKDRSLSVQLMSAVAMIEIGCATPEAVAEVLRTYECIELLPAGTRAPNHTWYELPARVLMAIGEDKPEVVPTLLQGARKYSPAVGASVMKALDGMGKGAAPALVKAYPKAEAKIRNSIVALVMEHDPPALRGLGAEYKKVVDSWIKELSGPDYAYRWNAVINLRDVRDTSPSVIAALTGALKDKHWTVRGEAAGALGTLGRPAAKAVAALQAAQQDENEIVRGIAKQAIARIQGAK